MTILGVDPGSQKIGLAVIAGEQTPFRTVIPPEKLGDTVRALQSQYPIEAIVLGSGTRSKETELLLRRIGLPLHIVDESRSTLDARRLYFEAYPPRGWRRFVPRGMLLPPRPIDDFAAELIARRFLSSSRHS